MKRSRVACCLVLLFLADLAVAQTEIDERPLVIGIEKVVDSGVWPDWLTGVDSGLHQEVRPVLTTGAGDGSKRLFVATQRGTIHIVPTEGMVNQTPLFLDLRDRVDFRTEDNEEGFLGLAFHPRFNENGLFVVCYTALPTSENPHLTIVSVFSTSSSDKNVGDPESERVLMQIPQPYNNHNGGTVVFGPDGYLYIVVGDGGAAGDPHDYAQSLQELYAKVLRIDVDRQESGLPYAVPPDNPFVAHPNARKEIWALGLRNVWRLSFDRDSGVCWGADVGQDEWEEINIIRKGGNYGWSLREGKHDFHWYRSGSGPRSDLIEPIWVYNHSVGKSITGGSVYRGKAVPALSGAYVYGDYVSGQIWALWYDAPSDRVTANRTILKGGKPITSFGEDDDGEMYFTTQNGDVVKFISID
ncbi:PQQ-dependent sugar dehydrogenase [Bythopirellula goksoeyrii]|uniref:Soluble aldose sugar dehydrogenase YliI n=1 Tax=Bythopirellula goksoeyrii TaxID=1400387 RepID=A0A5B9Q865_9BACT|nr:PQQ-dependent sugar dehydrogenase [Bythopirellula goksoeyrii]QEG33920.1 Soluble aldose sugar dehydrogenase YliI precursor [Bythopirellula goksoeyrii]